jgi:hypothetical protein
MKRNILTIAATLIAVVATVFNANADIKPYKTLDSKEVIMNYVGASLLGNTTYSNQMFADDFEYSNTANNNKVDKKTYMKHLKSVKDLKYNSTQTLEIIDQVGKTTVGKVTMDFGSFTRVDHITMIQSNDGWKISKVVTTYP